MGPGGDSHPTNTQTRPHGAYSRAAPSSRRRRNLKRGISAAVRAAGGMALDPGSPPPPVVRAASSPVGWEVPSTPHEHVRPPHLTEEEE